jgi:hypothetical protein
MLGIDIVLNKIVCGINIVFNEIVNSVYIIDYVDDVYVDDCDATV